MIVINQHIQINQTIAKINHIKSECKTSSEWRYQRNKHGKGDLRFHLRLRYGSEKDMTKSFKKVVAIKNPYFGVNVKRNDSGPRTDRLFL